MFEQLVKKFNLPIRKIIIAANAIDYLQDFLVQKHLIICDENTIKSVNDQGDKEDILCFGSDISAQDEHVNRIIQAAKNKEIIIAIGSGTINDLCKYASFKLSIPYVVFGTALSMNGYASANASITINGHKKTLKAHLPQSIFIDLNIAANAPQRLTQAGIGDSICRSTAQADWLLSHLLLGTYYNQQAFEILKPYENKLFENIEHHPCHTSEAWYPEQLETLAKTLISSGIGMYISGGSYPASQGEHMIAHCAEMLGNNNQNFHGEEIAVTTLYMAKLQEKILSLPHHPEIVSRSSTQLPFSQEINIQCTTEYRQKLEAMRNIDFSNWQDITAEINKIIRPHSEILTVLKSASCPTHHTSLGWSNELWNSATSIAKYTRNRFTFLDLGCVEIS